MAGIGEAFDGGQGQGSDHVLSPSGNNGSNMPVGAGTHTPGSRKRERTDQASHKIIEKKRRDRINNCLAELSKLIPQAYLKQGSTKLEKAEILEMTVRHLHDLSGGEDDETSLAAKSGYGSGYSDCVADVQRFLQDEGSTLVKDGSAEKLLSCLADKNKQHGISTTPRPSQAITSPVATTSAVTLSPTSQAAQTRVLSFKTNGSANSELNLPANPSGADGMTTLLVASGQQQHQIQRSAVTSPNAALQAQSIPGLLSLLQPNQSQQQQTQQQQQQQTQQQPTQQQMQQRLILAAQTQMQHLQQQQQQQGW
eukprot:scpid20849/ scgid11640/ Hairy and enhancer of split-related protein HELT; HES/HEY-like transcription factor; Protein Hes-like; Protein megane